MTVLGSAVKTLSLPPRKRLSSTGLCGLSKLLGNEKIEWDSEENEEPDDKIRPSNMNKICIEAETAQVSGGPGARTRNCSRRLAESSRFSQRLARWSRSRAGSNRDCASATWTWTWTSSWNSSSVTSGNPTNKKIFLSPLDLIFFYHGLNLLTSHAFFLTFSQFHFAGSDCWIATRFSNSEPLHCLRKTSLFSGVTRVFGSLKINYRQIVTGLEPASIYNSRSSLTLCVRSVFIYRQLIETSNVRMVQWSGM